MTRAELTDTWYICDEDGAVLEAVESNLYTAALEWRDITAERLGVDPESLDVLSADEYAEEYGEDM